MCNFRNTQSDGRSFSWKIKNNVLSCIMCACSDRLNTVFYFLILYNSASSLPNICSCKHTHICVLYLFIYLFNSNRCKKVGKPIWYRTGLREWISTIGKEDISHSLTKKGGRNTKEEVTCVRTFRRSIILPYGNCTWNRP